MVSLVRQVPIFGPSRQTSVENTPDQWNDYAEGLQKLANNDDVEDSSSNYAASVLET